MRFEGMRASLVCVVVWSSVAACVTTSNTSDAAADVAQYFPLAVGNSWSYRIVPGPPEPQQVQILKRSDKGFFVDDRGGKLMLKTDGIFDGDRYLLQGPLVVDHSWTALPRNQGLERYRIVATDAVVTVPAGTFSPCVEVRGEQPTPHGAPPGKLLVSWTYARGVGLIRFEQQVVLDGQAPMTTAKMDLLSFALKPAP